MQRIATLSFLAAIAVAACSGSQKSTDDQPVDTTTEKPIEGAEKHADEPAEGAEEVADQGEGIPFDDKTHEQQEAYMKLTVKPAMQKLFTEFDGEEFANFGCKTCHGKGVQYHNFEMPNPDLPALSELEEESEEHPEMAEFMKSKVVPEMAKLLGEEVWSPETKSGFGCGDCHPKD